MFEDPYPFQPYNRSRQPERKRKPNLSKQLVWGLLFAFLVAAIATAYLTFSYMRGIFKQPLNPVAVAAPQGTAAPSSPQMPAISPDKLNMPLQPQNGPAGGSWDGKSRINVLVVGLDLRDYEEGGPSRTDSMILLTLDPASRTAGMLSIPRDLWVPIPGYDSAKINTAYFIGQAEGLPGGGPGLAMQTVSQFLNVPINYYAQIDFDAFVKFINELGGVEVNVPEEISVDPIGPHNTVTLQPGPQLLKGDVALAYARNRDTVGNDFDRAQRQQQVVMAMRDRIISLNMLPVLISKAPVLYQQLADGVHTNLSMEQIINIAWTASQIEKQNIHQAAITLDQSTETYSWDGQAILMPNLDAIRQLRDEVFASTTEAAIGPVAPTLAATLAPTGDPNQLYKAENASISVLNGTFTAGLAARTRDYLTSQGFNVPTAGNADQAYQYTTIIDYTGKIYTRQVLAELLHVEASQVYSQPDPNSSVDIAVILGDDWAQNNTLP
jgi:LCP family protein required for cell wall assembly